MEDDFSDSSSECAARVNKDRWSGPVNPDKNKRPRLKKPVPKLEKRKPKKILNLDDLCPEEVKSEEDLLPPPSLLWEISEIKRERID